MISLYLLLPLTYIVLDIALFSVAGFAVSPPIIVLPLLFISNIRIDRNIFIFTFSLGILLFVINASLGDHVSLKEFGRSSALYLYATFIISWSLSVVRFRISSKLVSSLIKSLICIQIIVVSLGLLQFLELAILKTTKLTSFLQPYLTTSSNFFLEYLSFGGLRANSFYTEPSVFGVTLVSIWLSLEVLISKSEFRSSSKLRLISNALTAIGILCSQSFFAIPIYLVLAFFVYNFHVKTLQLVSFRAKYSDMTLLSISILLTTIFAVIFRDYLAKRVLSLFEEGSSLHYRLVGLFNPTIDSLTDISSMPGLGSTPDYLGSYELINDAAVGNTFDNGLYLIVAYFSWFTLIPFSFYIYMFFFRAKSGFDIKSRSAHETRVIAAVKFFPLISLSVTGAIFSPGFVFLSVTPYLFSKMKA